MKNILHLFTILALLTFTSNVEAQRGGGGPGGGGRGGPGGGRPGGPQQGLNQGNQNLQNQQFRNRFGNQNAANQNAANQNFANQGLANQNRGNQNMPSVAEMAQRMIANFDADGSGGLEQAELQNALTALRQMMRNRNNGQNQGFGNQQGNAANAQNQIQRGRIGQNNQAANGNAQRRPPRGGRRGR